MNSENLVKRLQNHDEKALETIMKQYTPLVSTIIFNVSGGKMNTSDIEEATADVFITLWKNADKVIPDKLKGYITSIAKSKAKNKIRSLSRHPDTDDIDEVIAISDYMVDKQVEDNDVNKILGEAIESIGEPDSEIILRHYYYYQSSGKIAEAMNMNVDTVKSKLRRGKEKLEKYLTERSVGYEFA